jgi:acyl-CoA thioester hydrolase
MSEPKIDLTCRSSFRIFAPITLRYADLDPVGHVNNVAVSAFIEQGRVSLLHPLLEPYAGRLDTVLARIVIDYLAEIRFPGTVEVATRLVRLGTRSMTIGNAVFVGDKAHATALCSSVFFDLASRRSAAPPPELRAKLERMVED